MKTKYTVIIVIVVLVLVAIFLFKNMNQKANKEGISLVPEEESKSLSYNALFTDKRVDETKAKLADYEAKLGTAGNDDYGTYINMALLESNLGEGEKVLTYLNAAIKIDPKKTLAYNNAGTMFERIGAYKSAENAFKTALALDPHSTYTYALLIDLQKSYFNAPFEVVDSLFKEALLNTNNDLQTMKDYANYLEENHKWQESVVLWQKALDLETDQTAKELIFQEIARISDKIRDNMKKEGNIQTVPSIETK